MKGRNRRIIISGGGTGGHVFPAIAIADALKNLLGDPEILFVGAEGRLEMEKVPQAGYKIIGLPVQGLKRSLSPANVKVALKLLKSLRMAGKIIRSFSPDAAVGVGGYASGPLLRKAAGMGIPTLIQEQNSYAGVTNRLLAKKALKICVAYEGMEKYFPGEKLVIAGNPVRDEIRRIHEMGASAKSGKVRREAREAFGIPAEAKLLLVLGGSLGARTINESVLGSLEKLKEAGITLLWQCGKYYYEDLRSSLGTDPPERLVLKDFIRNMDQAYIAADAIVSRAGALTISELCLVGKPSILVPSPNVAEDHQTRNANSLAEKSAAMLIPDKDARKELVPEAIGLLADEERMDLYSKNISGLALPGSAEKIANEVLDLMKNES